MLSDDEAKDLVLNILKNPTERDKQTRIGASQIGDPCNYCFTLSVAGIPKRESRFWLAARLGTALHESVEILETSDEPWKHNVRLSPLKHSAVERKILIADVPHYGEIWSRPDLVVEPSNLFDWKTSKKDKIKRYKLDGVPLQYRVQQNLYAYGLRQAGVPIERMHLVFVPLDGHFDEDIWLYSFDYDQSLVDTALQRVEAAAKWLADGGDIESIDSHPDCFYCNVIMAGR